MSVDERYQAFLSYSHADREIAQWLHRALETYRLPRKLVGQATALGPVPARLQRIFKDREELAASGNLGAAIEAALAASDALIVICSRVAAASRWVNEEIRNYKRLHGEARVFAVIVDGEPFASNIAGRESDECFPPALRFTVDAAGTITDHPAEPIAADLRDEGDGKRLAKLKLVAGLTGAKLNDLVRRESQRRAARMTWVALGASALALVMTVLSVFAFRARNDARGQREQAEGLIEFMLVDLRKKLEPVGRLDALDVVGEKALSHYDAQNQKDLDANSLGHRSRALHLIGEIRQKRGKLGDALIAFERAAATTAELLARTPNDEQRIFDHAQSVFWVGTVARERGQRQDAESAFLQYRDLAQRLVAQNGTKREWQIESAYAALNLGIITLEDARPAEALRYLNETRDIMSRHVAAQPDLAFDLAHAIGWIALSQERMGAYDRAIDAQQAKQALFRSVPDADKSQRVKRGLQNAESQLARLYLARGEMTLAEEHALASVAAAATLVTVDPSNFFWLTDYTTARLGLCEAELALGKTALAREHLKQARADIGRLIARDATKTEWVIAMNGRALAIDAQTGNPNPSQLVAEARAYVSNMRLLLDGGLKIPPGELLAGAAAEFELGGLLNRLGNRDEALTHWRQVASRLEPHQQETNFALLTLLARARLAMGEREAAEALARRIEASPYRHPAFAELINQMNGGKGPASSPTTARSTP